ncbi:putative Acylphosphate phosphohydrolase [Alkalibacterium sp. AK22]|uniref:acylphosphatase n=1 Tax=Alkalibacterium sp. AK22 TaxID=1229520 RepID=UPI0004487A90|nr:acylphosphatase [Alkalibacterium sp. AK22]EXJ22755.1 putative Acylphosphate phosphohydrolase [Alkalibacterium sp. AK22]
MSSIFKDFFNMGKADRPGGEVIYTNEVLADTSQQKLRAIVSGRVQGVGFRFSTKQAADELGIKGIVRNEPDGTVYTEAVGSEDQLSAFVEALRKGPSPASQVDKVVVTYDEKIEEKANFSQVN